MFFFWGGANFWGRGPRPPPSFYCPGVSGTVISYQGHNFFENPFIANYLKSFVKMCFGGKTPLIVQNFELRDRYSTR